MSTLFRALFLFGLVGGAGLASASTELRIVYTANRNGEIEPCHCVDHQLGGVVRLKSFLDTQRKSREWHPVIWGDAGDAFFSLPSLPESERAREWLRAKAIARAFAKLGLDAFGPGERDFAEGIDSLKTLQRLTGAIFVAGNLTDEQGKPLFETSHVFQNGPLRIGVLSLASPEAFHGVEGVKVGAPLPALEREVSALRGKGAQIVILLSHLGLAQDREIAALGKVDVILGSHSNDPLPKPQRIAKTIIVQPLDQGQQVGVIDYMLPELVVNRHQIVDLDERLDGKNDLVAIVEGYKKDLHDLEAGMMQSREAASSRPYVAHPFQCRSCHEAQYDFWAGTKHAGAYLTLYAKNQHFDPSCVVCHTLGYNMPGGFSRIAAPLDAKGMKGRDAQGLTPVEQLMKTVFGDVKNLEALDSRANPEQFEGLKKKYLEQVHQLEKQKRIRHLYLGVQCEHCHGDLNGHPGPGGLKPMPVVETTCRGCHRPPNAPEFDPKWRTRIACPLMKK